MSSLLICEFTMVATMDITMPPKLIIVHAKIKTYYDMPFDAVVLKMIVKDVCMIRASKKKDGLDCKYCECHHNAPHHHPHDSTF